MSRWFPSAARDCDWITSRSQRLLFDGALGLTAFLLSGVAYAPLAGEVHHESKSALRLCIVEPG
ncbi:MAG TPA: hypothetical protein VK550_16610 [Polyangiaceae bacterium]|nr:hypothetical protein [Polyangiaceae bacterium]